MNRLQQWKTTVYCTDHWEAYGAAIPPEKHCITKRETVAIERNNCLQRHWLGRFRRRTVIVSKSLQMVDLSIALFAYYRINGNMDALPSLHG
jgi:IS1 family transposase